MPEIKKPVGPGGSREKACRALLNLYTSCEKTVQKQFLVLFPKHCLRAIKKPPNIPFISVRKYHHSLLLKVQMSTFHTRNLRSQRWPSIFTVEMTIAPFQSQANATFHPKIKVRKSDLPFLQSWNDKYALPKSQIQATAARNSSTQKARRARVVPEPEPDLGRPGPWTTLTLTLFVLLVVIVKTPSSLHVTRVAWSTWILLALPIWDLLVKAALFAQCDKHRQF